MVIPASRGIARIAHLDAFLREEGDAVVGWGAKPSGERAKSMASRAGTRWLLIEDGFLRSVERDAPPLSLMVDDLGIYYNADAPSRLERLIAESLSPEQRSRALALGKSWRMSRVSKYNHAREFRGELPARFVLVVDQTYGDASVRGGKADPSSFERMLRAALGENPDCTILVKVHPDTISGKKRGYFDIAELVQLPRVRVLAEGCHAVRLIEEALAIYTVTSQMGFEGLLWDKPVRCFGMPFYAGWGLTRDELPAPSRRGSASLEQLVHAALISCPRYIDPETGVRCEVERVLTHIASRRRAMASTNQDRIPPLWKRAMRPLRSLWNRGRC